MLIIDKISTASHNILMIYLKGKFMAWNEV